MQSHLKNLAPLVIMFALGAWATMPFREPSIALLGFLAFVTLVGPVLFAIPILLTTNNVRNAVLLLCVPFVAFTATKLIFRLRGFSDEPMLLLLLVFAIGAFINASIAWPIARLHNFRSQTAKQRFISFACVLIAINMGTYVWLAVRNTLPSQLCWVGLIGLGILDLIGVLLRRETITSAVRPT